ncbi:plasmid maintenance system killer protein [Azospirillum brasilense]|uniref:Plasmid maintenance system killer protein n=1 Tax=Azospirillum brasilense TaxID=192 RepID=A0A560BFU2_AZOBR|nr:plasmid maintenance system killer protein [Azospirillum brasilense]
MAILSFADNRLEHLYRTEECPDIGADLRARILLALDRLNVVSHLQELKLPRSLRLSKDHREPNRFRIHVKDATWISFVWQHPDCLEVRLE